MVPISRLSTDILVHIFQELVDMEHRVPASSLSGKGIPKYPTILAHVCAEWRQIVCQTPSLWSRIRFTSDVRTNKQFLAYMDFHSIRAEQALMDVYISDLSFIRLDGSHNSITLDPFIGRIRSLEFQLGSRGISLATSKIKVCYLIARYLGANHSILRRFVLNMNVWPMPQLQFMECASKLTHHNSLAIDLPYDQLEDALYSITDLWLTGLYFNWESKAYHGLTKLRLDICDSSSSSIPESKLTNILVNSPQLRHLNIDLDITQKATLPPITHLPELEVLVGDVSLPKLIWPGTKELSLTIIGQPKRDSGALYDSRVHDFFTRANMNTFFSDIFLHDAAELCHLLHIAPHIRVLALTKFTLSGTLPKTDIYPSLDVFYLLGDCEIDYYLLQRMVETWKIKKLVFSRQNRIVRDSSTRLIDSAEELEEVLSGLNVLFEFVLDIPGGFSLLDMFMGPTFN
ncbi:unnamed protein product [Rhizoctonia solani]|uniref:F-box domain-containing protein n=1 Tax=Rhizoctonia solani TaxID=456999 RepID=A0A8H2WTX7_9AGAM|nr:unnamed protein product [Rhizoctonia solani]